MKENFPSKIFLSQDNLDQCKPLYQSLSPTEELRRQLSCLLSLRDEGRLLWTTDEIEDLWHTLQFAEKLNDAKGINTCLEMLAAQIAVNKDILRVIDKGECIIRIANKSDYNALSSNKYLA